MSLIVVFRDFVLSLAETFVSSLRIIVLTRLGLKKWKRSAESAIILGNGPSLKDFLAHHVEAINGRDVFAVNNFCRTEEYERIKPTHYVIASPEHFLKDKKEEFHEDRKITFKMMAERTSWPMNLIVPALAKNKKEWRTEIDKNPKISIQYMNTTPIEGFQVFRHWAFSNRFGMPRPHNVLIACIFIATRLRYKEVLLTGSDHSWLGEIRVTPGNEVLLSQKHFYDDQTKNDIFEKNKPTEKPMYKGISQEKRRLHEVLEKFFISFRSYWILKAYASSNNVTITNLTLDSFIDAFDKKDPETLK